MSTVTEPRATPSTASTADDHCGHCGAPLTDDQEWCLECGAARTVIHRPPGWKVPTLVIGTVIAVVLAAFAIALIALSSNASQTSQSRAGQTVTVIKTVRSPRSRAAIGGWPTGLAGWTVALARSHSRARAYATARRLDAAGFKIGVLSSTRHPSMAPGYWIAFSGRYPNRTTATAAAVKLGAQGSPTGQALEVAPPGGI